MSDANETVRYVCPECFNSYGQLSDFWTHRQVHGWRQLGERNWFRSPYDARPETERRIAELEAQVCELKREIAALTIDSEAVNLGSFRKDG